MFENLYYYILVKFSGMFDREYYLQQYPEVRQSGLSPLMHFLKQGWREGKNPSRDFNTRLYLELHPDVENAEVNPLVHYLRHGMKESRQILSGESDEIQLDYVDLFNPDDFRKSFPRGRSEEGQKTDIILFPIIDWHYRFQRPQQLASQLAQSGHRIFYLRTGFFKHPLPQIKQIQKNIFSVKLAREERVITFNTTLTDEDVAVLGLSLMLLKEACSIDSAIMLVDLPFWRNLVLFLQETQGWKCVYDCMDLHTGFSISTEHTAHDEQQLLEKSDLVLATSHFLFKHAKQHNDKVILVPNGTEYEFFHQAAQKIFVKEIQGLNKPIIGYYGAIADWFDTWLVRDLAVNHPEWEFLMIGSTLFADIKPLKNLYNVHLLGEKPYAEIPGYLSHFDVGIIPFKRTPLTDATNPVKMYEYLSAGKPIVATKMDEISHYAEYVHLCESIGEWEKALQASLAEEKTPELLEKRFAFARENTWESRAEVIEGELNRLKLGK